MLSDRVQKKIKKLCENLSEKNAENASVMQKTHWIMQKFNS